MAKQSKPKPEVAYKPKNPRQKEAMAAWPDTRLMLMIGEAGTGKTASALGMSLLDLFASTSSVRKIVILRPTVTVGERLGHLPGDLDQKILPYFGPIEDCFEGLTGEAGKTVWAALKDRIEVMPVGMVRGRTFRHSCVILDEAQNCLAEQLVAVATRIGAGSKMVMCGDAAQSDLPVRPNPFAVFTNSVRAVPGVSVVRFLPEDQQRDAFVTALLAAMG